MAVRQYSRRSRSGPLTLQTALDTVFFLENGADTVVQRLAPGQATVFPAGGIHAEMNIGCDTAMFVAASVFFTATCSLLSLF